MKIDLRSKRFDPNSLEWENELPNPSGGLFTQNIANEQKTDRSNLIISI
jgi:hypothetical protein